MGFSRQEYWSGLPCPPPGDVPNPGIESMSLMSPALAGGFFTTSASWEAQSSPPPPLNQVLWASLPEVPSKHDSINMCADDLNSLLSCSLKPTFFSQYDVCFITLHLFRTWILPSWKMLEVLKKETWYSLKCCIIGPSGAPTWAGPPLRPHSGLLAAASQLYLDWPPGTGIFHHLWKFPCNSVFLAPVLRITPN